MKLKSAVLVACMGMVLGGAVASAQTANSQQTRMATCNADAKTKNLAGDERKKFMSTCLSNKAEATAAPASQQEKMKTCNADAKKQALKGDARKQFMSTCLSGSAPAAH